MWDPQLVLAEQGWRVIVPQLRGFDRATDDPPATSIDDYAGDAIDLLDALHIDDAVIGGLSMGGYIAFAMFQHAPRYARALILADTRPQPDTPEGIESRKRMLSLLRVKGPSAVADDLLPKLVGDTTRRERPEVVERLRAMITSNTRDAIAGAISALMTRCDQTSLLASIHCPTLIVVGDEDAITPPALSEEMQRAIAGSELVMITGAGHMSNMERPDEFNRALARFLEHRV
jgi:pimeloyl-ACP methyl ester carboxylesterase